MKPKVRNHLYTQSYFLRRLRNSGYNAVRLPIIYSQSDSRAWTVIIDPGGASAFCTLMRNVDGPGEDYFELYDSAQFVPGRLKIKTSSFEVVATWLNDLGIVHKHPGGYIASDSDSDE